jgi:peptidoglycan-associated lipoprotein
MTSRLLAGSAVIALCFTLGACAKKNVAATTPPAPAPATIPATPAPARAAVTPAPVQAPVATAERPKTPDAATKARIQDLIDRIQDAYFDYAKSAIRPDAGAALQKDAQTLAEILRQYPDYKLTVEGYCDDRGSEEYNLALGEERATKAKEYVTMLGVPASQLRTVSYGKEKPVCTEQTEECWQKNRRAHITQAQ